MADAGFFKGTSAEQDSRFANKQKKLLQQMKFPDNINVKIDMLKVNLDVMKPWITKRLQELLGIEDDVVIEFVFNQLDEKRPDPKMMQINLTGFLGGSKARIFIGELWAFLASAQASPDGIPIELVEMKKKELLKRQEEDDRLREIRKREEESHKHNVKIEMEKAENRRQMQKKSPVQSRRYRARSASVEIVKVSERKKRSPSNSNDENRTKKKVNDVSKEKIQRKTRPTSSSSSSSEIEKEKKSKKKSQSTRHRSRSSSNHRHKSRKHSKPSSRKHHDSKHKSHRHDHHRESTAKNHRKPSTKKKYSKSPEKEILSSSPKKPRLESQIRVQTPPPPPPAENQKVEPSQEVPAKSTRTFLLEESRSDPPSRTLSSRISIVSKPISNDEQPSEIPHSSDDEHEIDLRERLLREKAIKSMKRRQISSDNHPTMTDRIVYETQ